MKNAIIPEKGQPLKIGETEIPKPGPGEILIRQKITGICYRDLLTQDGYFPRARFPITPGHEISGTIVELGEGVENFKVGDRIASLIYRPCGKCRYCKTGNENLCPNKQIYGENLPGSYAEYILVHQNSVVKVPDSVGDHEATIASCVTGMILHALQKVGKLREGETLLVTGSGGGVGMHAVQIGKILGARVIAETSSPEKMGEIRNLGADEVISYSDNFSRQIKNVTDGGVDVVLETTGIHTFSQSLRSLNTGGRMVVIGNLKPEPVPLPLGLIILKGNSISGSISSTREDLREALHLSSSGKYKAIWHTEEPLQNVNEAFQLIRQKGNRGRVFLRLGE